MEYRTLSDLMAALAEAGAPFEAIKIAIKAVEERDLKIEAARSAAADRQARYRARRKRTQAALSRSFVSNEWGSA